MTKENLEIINILIIFLITILMLYLTKEELKSYNEKEFKDYKSTIISIGVLGTFIGIFLGLILFNTKEISSSIPTLLDGLKTAFLTSIEGMFFSIFLTIKSIKEGKDIPKVSIEEIDIKLKELNSNQKNLLHKIDKLDTFLEVSLEVLLKNEITRVKKESLNLEQKRKAYHNEILLFIEDFKKELAPTIEEILKNKNKDFNLKSFLEPKEYIKEDFPKLEPNNSFISLQKNLTLLKEHNKKLYKEIYQIEENRYLLEIREIKKNLQDIKKNLIKAKNRKED